MRNVKCSNCEEYKNAWCEKIIDSPYPDIPRDCQYWHERKDMVEVVRCKDCKYAHITYRGEVKYCDIWFPDESHYMDTDNYCSFAERKGADNVSDEQDNHHICSAR